MRASFTFVSACAALALAACDGDPSESEEGETGAIALGEAASAPEVQPTTPIAVGESTPMAERVATIGLLNKRNNVSQDFEMRPGETLEDGPVILTLAACERTAPFEFPQETGAFVQIDAVSYTHLTLPTNYSV